MDGTHFTSNVDKYEVGCLPIKGKLPPGAVRLTNTEVLKKHRKILEHIDPPVKVFPLQHGGKVLGVTGALQAAYIVHIFRRRYHLGAMNLLSTFGGISALTLMHCYITHEFFVRDRVLLGAWDCPSCMSIRSSLVQGASSSFIPLVLAPAMSLKLARENFSEFFLGSQSHRNLKKLAPIPKQSWGIVMGLVITNMALALVMGGLEVQCFSEQIMPKIFPVNENME